MLLAALKPVLDAYVAAWIDDIDAGLARLGRAGPRHDPRAVRPADPPRRAERQVRQLRAGRRHPGDMPTTRSDPRRVCEQRRRRGRHRACTRPTTSSTIICCRCSAHPMRSAICGRCWPTSPTCSTTSSVRHSTRLRLRRQRDQRVRHATSSRTHCPSGSASTSSRSSRCSRIRRRAIDIDDAATSVRSARINVLGSGRARPARRLPRPRLPRAVRAAARTARCSTRRRVQAVREHRRRWPSCCCSTAAALDVVLSTSQSGRPYAPVRRRRPAVERDDARRCPAPGDPDRQWLRLIDGDHGWRADGAARVRRPGDNDGGNGNFPLFESLRAPRTGFRTLFDDWENDDTPVHRRRRRRARSRWRTSPTSATRPSFDPNDPLPRRQSAHRRRQRRSVDRQLDHTWVTGGDVDQRVRPPTTSGSPERDHDG